jgi:hypothetical protein
VPRSATSRKTRSAVSDASEKVMTLTHTMLESFSLAARPPPLLAWPV